MNQKTFVGEKWDMVIKPKRNLLDFNLRELWDYRDLLYMFIKREIVVVYKQTILGPIWYIIQPVLTMLVYIFVFGKIANISSDGIPRPIFYLSGIIMWSYFSECFSQTSETFVQNAQIFGKVYFPRLTMPLAKIISNLIKFFIQCALFLIVYVYFILKGGQVNPNYSLVLVPYFLFLVSCLGLGSGIIFSSLTTKYRDLTFLIKFGIQLLMYATPIIYPMSTIPEKYQKILWMNPLSHIFEGFKYAFLGAGKMSTEGMIYASFCSFIILTMGILFFNKMEQNFMDTV